MTELIWGQNATSRFEAGVSHGVFYSPDIPDPTGSWKPKLKIPGVVWNGLLSVDEKHVGGERESYYYDGVQYMNFVGQRNFQAVVKAFSHPIEMLPFLGDRPVIPGFILTRQPRSRFGFSYRTNIDSNSEYKIHLVYNALATPSSKAYSTAKASPDPVAFDWTIDAVPESVPGFRATSHFVVNSLSANESALSTLENKLYGTVSTDPAMPSVSELFDLFD